jgi:UDP-N-acetylglucosamine 2-epimerase (non-hydrolysing)
MVIAIVAGTRPEIIKVSPIIKEMQRQKIEFNFIHAGQHNNYSMFSRFIEELELPQPDVTIEIEPFVYPLEQVIQMVSGLGKTLLDIKPSLTLIQGDTNSVLAAGIAANKLGIPVGHIEAGLRSGDMRMPEEYNRRIADQISTLLFAPTRSSYSNLKNEKVLGKSFIVGNTIIDAINQNFKILTHKEINFEIHDSEQFILLTLHRKENVDNADFLSMVIESIAESKLPVLFPIHPRTWKRVRENIKFYNMISKSKNIKLVDPVGYFEFLYLMKKCKFIITDSGGIQEEITSPLINKRAIVLRKTTDRPEAVRYGFSFLPKLNKKSVVKAINTLNLNEKSIVRGGSPFGQGNAAGKIINIIVKEGFIK